MLVLFHPGYLTILPPFLGFLSVLPLLVLYGSANDPRTANDPRPDQKVRNGMDGGMVWIGNWRT